MSRSAEALFSGPAPRVRTIPAGVRFLDALAGLLDEAFPDAEQLSGVSLLLPTRRAGRALARRFSELSPRQAALLPMIRPLGDVDADEPPFEPGELAVDAPPSISPARRRFELARLILEKERRLERRIGAGGALALADQLAGLIDDLHTEESADLGRIDAAVRAELPAHLQEAALFLDIVLELWPERLKELGAVDPARRRSLLLNALSQRWRERPPEGSVIVAGSTGSIPAAARLMETVAQLPKGVVILPGFAADMDARAWREIDDAHPQRAMKGFIEQLGIDRSAVVTLGAAAEPARARLIGEALRPASTTDDWLGSVERLRADLGDDAVSRGLSGLAAAEAATPAEEARAVGLMLRETLETPERTAMLVTPDRGLARRVCAEMRRYGVVLDDSAGEPLSDTAAGVFLMRVADAALDPGAAAPLAALWTSPLFSLGEDRASLRPDLGALERLALRGRRPGRDMAGLREAVAVRLADRRRGGGTPEAAMFAKRADAVLERIEAALAPLTGAPGPQPAAFWARGLAQAAEALAAGPDRGGAERLWAGDAGEAAASLVREFLEESEALPPVTLPEFRRALLETARARPVRPRYGAHPRLQVLGPLEARLLSADRVILAGLNEGVWPAHPAADPFLSRNMRIKAGLAAPERRFGLAAHDFAQLAASPDAILTRSERADGAPADASRWLWRLMTLARGAGADAGPLQEGARWLEMARALDDHPATPPMAPPHPSPPVEARPASLSVTEIERWVRDPYAIYARRILKLEKLDPLDEAPGPRERGTAYHAALEAWLRETKDQPAIGPDAQARLIDLGAQALAAEGFPDGLLEVERRRFARAAAWLCRWERTRRAEGWRPIDPELRGVLERPRPSGGAFTLRGRADRFDIGPGGALCVIDYKTGAPPTAKQVAAGFSPQLPLLAAMARAGGVEGLDPDGLNLGGLLYLQVSGGTTPGKEARIDTAGTADAETLADQALARLDALIRRYDTPDAAYPSWPRAQFQKDAGDFDHLARRKEWSRALGGEDGGEA